MLPVEETWIFLQAPDSPNNLNSSRSSRRAGFQTGYCGTPRQCLFALGDGGEITAVVMVNGSAVGNPIKVADVATGLAIKAKAGSRASNAQTATTMPWLPSRIQEGYAGGIISGVHK